MKVLDLEYDVGMTSGKAEREPPKSSETQTDSHPQAKAESPPKLRLRVRISRRVMNSGQIGDSTNQIGENGPKDGTGARPERRPRAAPRPSAPNGGAPSPAPKGGIGGR